MPEQQITGLTVDPAQSLEVNRAHVAELDAQIAGALAERFAATREIGLAKTALGLGVYDGAQEARGEQAVGDLCAELGIEPELCKLIKDIFSGIRRASRTDQDNQRVSALRSRSGQS